MGSTVCMHVCICVCEAYPYGLECMHASVYMCVYFWFFVCMFESSMAYEDWVGCMHACMCGVCMECLHVGMNVYIHACRYAYECVPQPVRMRLCIYASTCACMLSVHACMLDHVCMHVCTFVCINAMHLLCT
jgi:hypothetical protein